MSTGWPEMPEELREDLHGKWSEREVKTYWHGRAVSDAWGELAIERVKEEHSAEVGRLRAAIARVAELHKNTDGCCQTCTDRDYVGLVNDWPCDTIRALAEERP